MFNKERARNAREVFASNLRNCLAQAHKNQIDVANDLGITASTVSDWYNGKKYPRIESMQRLADYLQVPLSRLREDPNEREQLPEEIVILNRAAKKMTPENRKKLLDMARIMFQEEFAEDE